jgi:hypothetical protein
MFDPIDVAAMSRGFPHLFLTGWDKEKDNDNRRQQLLKRGRKRLNWDAR